MRLVDGHDVDALATAEVGLTAAADTARIVSGGDFHTGRVQIGDDHAWMRILAGTLPELDLLGYKEFHRVGKEVRYHVSLFRHSTGEALGIVDGRRITSLRTSSTAALAFRHVFGRQPLSLAVVGSGEEAREGLRALTATLEVRAVRLWSPTLANRVQCATTMADELGVPVTVAASARETMDDADAAYIATAARSPVVSHDDVASLRFVGAVGATRPDHHELRGDVVANAAAVIVDCADALHEPGDMRDALRYGFDTDRASVLGNWLEQPPAATTSSPLLFKSIGSVEQDLVLAYHLLSEAERRGLGRVVDPIGSTRVMR